MVHIAVIGDIHQSFSPRDVAYFNQSKYQLLLFVGDLANWRHSEGLVVARLISRLEKPTLVIPGNHDTIIAPQLLAEIKRNEVLIRLLSRGQGNRMDSLAKALGKVPLVGYSSHYFELSGIAFDVVAGRPFSMGGEHLAYQPFLSRRFGVHSLQNSSDKMIQCVNRTKTDHLIFLAHNGPSGLGTTRADIWGCDFKPEEGDFGDPDLSEVVNHAYLMGKRIIAVVAGHMHHRLNGGGQRKWLIDVGGVCYLNAAYVPRVFQKEGPILHHHIHLSFDGSNASVSQVFI